MNCNTNIIRHIAPSCGSPLVAFGEFERVVHVWNLETLKKVCTFDSVLDFGGRRIALSRDGSRCAAAAYHRHGVACYSASTGEVIWERRDLRRTQELVSSQDSKRLYVLSSDQPCRVLDMETGETISSLPGVRDAYESACDPVLLVGKKELELISLGGPRLGITARKTFALLSMCAGPGCICISESGGPVTCMDLTLDEMWVYNPPEDSHVQELSYDRGRSGFVGVEWAFVNGGPRQLLGFDSLGVPERMLTFDAWEHAFCLQGTRLVTGDGDVLDTMTGKTIHHLPFPAWECNTMSPESIIEEVKSRRR